METLHDRGQGWIRYATTLLVCCIIAALYSGCIAGLCTVQGRSMLPAHKPGQMVMIQKAFYTIERFDIISFRAEGIDMIKRVIGMPGDTVKFDRGIVYINGEPTGGEVAWFESGDWALGANEYFVMGDNRAESIDSREYGPVRGKNFIGKVSSRG